MPRLSRIVKQQKLATAAMRLATSLEKGTFKGTLGAGTAIQNGEAVCTFGVVATRAGVVPKDTEYATSNPDLLVKIMGIGNAAIPEAVSVALAALTTASDGAEPSQRNVAVVAPLRDFAKAIRAAKFSGKQ